MQSILIFSVSIGAGHDAAARAVADRFTANLPGCQVKIVQMLDYINPMFLKVVRGSYLGTLKINPKMWGFIYNQTEEKKTIPGVGEAMNMISYSAMTLLLSKFKPDVVIATHPFPAGILSSLKECDELKAPLCVILTDFCSHSFWIHDYVDKYYLATGSMVYECEDKGIPMDKMIFTGIPIDHKFATDITAQQKEDIRANYNLDKRPILLVMGGGIGLGGVYDIAKSIAKATKEWQIIAIAGNNKGLHHKLDKLSVKYSQIRSLGFVENVHELMSISDFLISKPGGLSVSEALAVGLPIVIVKPLPGQEERNAKFLLDMGVALAVKDPDDLVMTLRTVFHEPKRIAQMKEMAVHFGRKDSANAIYQSIYDQYLK